MLGGKSFTSSLSHGDSSTVFCLVGKNEFVGSKESRKLLQSATSVGESGECGDAGGVASLKSVDTFGLHGTSGGISEGIVITGVNESFGFKGSPVERTAAAADLFVELGVERTSGRGLRVKRSTGGVCIWAVVSKGPVQAVESLETVDVSEIIESFFNSSALGDVGVNSAVITVLTCGSRSNLLFVFDVVSLTTAVVSMPAGELNKFLFAGVGDCGGVCGMRLRGKGFGPGTGGVVLPTC